MRQFDRSNTTGDNIIRECTHEKIDILNKTLKKRPKRRGSESKKNRPKENEHLSFIVKVFSLLFNSDCSVTTQS